MHPACEWADRVGGLGVLVWISVGKGKHRTRLACAVSANNSCIHFAHGVRLCFANRVFVVVIVTDVDVIVLLWRVSSSRQLKYER